MTEEPQRPAGREHDHRHGHSIYEAEEFLDAPPDEQVPPAEVSLARRFANVRTIGSIVFALLLLFLFFRVVLDVPFEETWRLISNADPLLLLLALASYYATFPLRGLRWWFVLGRVGTHVPYRSATEILFLSWFVNCLVPAKLGDLYRAYLLRENFAASVSRTVGTVFIERIVDIVVIFGLAVAAGYWSFRGRSTAQLDAIFLAGFAFAALLAIFVLSLRMWGLRIAPFLPGRLRNLFERFREGSVSALTPRALAVLVVLTVVIWLAESLRLFLVVRALDLPTVGLGISSAVFVALAASLLTAIPLTPAGIGFVEAGIVVALGIYGVDETSATAVALTDRALSIVSVIIIGAVAYALSGLVRRAHAPAPSVPPATGG